LRNNFNEIRDYRYKSTNKPIIKVNNDLIVRWLFKNTENVNMRVLKILSFGRIAANYTEENFGNHF